MRRRPDCPICHSHAGEVEFALPYDAPEVETYLDEFYGTRQNVQNRVEMTFLRDERLVVRRCPDCDLYWHEYVLDDEGMYELYEHWIDATHSRQKRNDWERRRGKVEMASSLQGFFEGQTGPEDVRVLDFGMGWGTYAQAVSAWGCDVHGVEISETRRARVDETEITTHESMSDVEGKFDVVTAHQTFEHVPDPSGTLAALCEVLADDGLVHITTPSVTEEPTEDTVLTKGPFQPLEHINGFTRTATLELAAKHDLSPVSPTPGLVSNPVTADMKQRLKTGLRLLNVFWIYESLTGMWRSNASKPQFFTPQ